MHRGTALGLSLLWPAVLAGPQAAPEAAWLLSPAPAQTVWEMRGQYNGQPMAMRVLTVPGSVAQWLAQAQQALGASGPPVLLHGRSSVSGQWRDQWVTLAARDAGAQQVEITLWQRGVARAAAVSGAAGLNAGWLAPDSVVFSDQRTEEEGTQVHMVTAGNTHSVRANVEHVERALRQRGLEPFEVYAARPDGPWTAQAQRRGEQVRVSVVDHGRYRAVVLWWRQEHGA